MKKFKTAIITAFILIIAVTTASAKEVTYTGTGIIPGIKRGTFIVQGVYPGSPAYKAGIRPGDKIVNISTAPGGRTRSLGMMKRYLNPLGNRKVKVTIDRGGKARKFTLTSATFPISYRNTPRGDIYRGRIREVDRAFLISDLRQSKCKAGNCFYIIDGSKCTGIASIHGWKDGKCQMMLRHDPSIKKEDLVGAQLYFFDHGVRQMSTKAKLAEDPKLARIDDRMYHEYKNRRDLKRDAGKVISHNSRTRRIVVEVTTRMSSTTPNTVTRYYKYFPIYYQATTPSIPKRVISKIKAGDYIGFFYKKTGGKNRAKLIHLLKEYERKKKK